MREERWKGNETEKEPNRKKKRIEDNEREIQWKRELKRMREK